MLIPSKKQSDFLRRKLARPERKQFKSALIIGAMLLVSIALFTLLLNLTMPDLTKSKLSGNFSSSLQATTATMDIRCSSAWRLLIGKSESIDLTMTFDDNSLLALSQLHAHWNPSNVALGLMRQGKGGERDAEPNETELYWDEKQLAAYLNLVQGEVQISRVEISETQVKVYGSITLTGRRHSIYLAARPVSDDLGRVVFTASEWQAEGLAPTEQLKTKIGEALSFMPDLSPLAWKVWPKQVVLKTGEMLVYGSSSCCR